MVNALASSDRNGRFARTLRQRCREIHEGGLVISDTVLIPLMRRAMEPRHSVSVIYGPTGCGKTYACEAIAEAADRKLIRIDASQIVATGYHGVTVGKIIAQIAEAQRDGQALLLLDEVDKLSTDSSHGSWLDQVVGQVLTLLQGGTISSERDGDSGKVVTADLSTTCIILAGSFSRIGGRQGALPDAPGYAGFTFGASGKSIFMQSSGESDDFSWLLKIGGFFSPEVVGRISFVAGLPALDETALYDIAVRQRYEFSRRAMRHYGEHIIDVRPPPEAAALARAAQDRSLGARWIRTALEKWVDDIAELVVNASDEEFSQAFPGESNAPAAPQANPFRPQEAVCGIHPKGQSLVEYKETEHQRMRQEREAERAQVVAQQEAAAAGDDDPFGQVDADYEAWLQDQADRAAKADEEDEQELIAGESP